MNFSKPMSLAQLDQDMFLRQVHYSLERVRFALESYRILSNLSGLSLMMQ